METLLTVFIAVTAAAVVLQMFILFGMFITMRKMATRVEGLADKVEDTTSVVQTRVLPILENTKALVEHSRPKVETLVDNLSHISGTARGTADRLQVTLNDAIDRTRLQVIRGDEMLTRTMNHIEETSDKVQQSVMSPVRQISGLAHAISIGVGAYFSQPKRRRNGGPPDEMFI
jgi:methyl-accepting chemotaxis protein